MAHLRLKSARITALRASVAYSLTDDELSWPVVEWNEEDGTENIAIFHVDQVEPEECSWMMHSGVGTSDHHFWQSSRVDWNVSDIDDLKMLFGVTQRVLGILDWSTADALALYCGAKCDSKEGYLYWLVSTNFVKNDEAGKAPLHTFVATKTSGGGS